MAFAPSPTVHRARSFLRPLAEPGELLAFSRMAGRVVEFSEDGYFGVLSLLVEVLRQVQLRHEQIAWIATGNSVFFPPDLAFQGLDVQAISVVLASGAPSGLQAADWLLRSGAFGLVVVDWGPGPAEDSVLGRLSKLAQDRETALLFLTRKPPSEMSLGTLVSLRFAVSTTDSGEIELAVVKDKRAGPLATQRMSFRGPFGMY